MAHAEFAHVRSFPQNSGIAMPDDDGSPNGDAPQHRVGLDLAGPSPVIERDYDAVLIAELVHGTILRMGNSMIPVAPASRSSGMRTLMSAFATTVSTA